MNVSYNKLWKLLIDNGWKKKDLLKMADLSPATVSRLSKNETVSMYVLMKICKALNCDIGDILQFIKK